MLVVITAFVVSLPYTLSILFHYHLHVVNAVPSNWVYPPLALSKLSTFLGSFLSWFALVAGVGLVTVLWAGHGQARILLLTWLVVSFLALALNEIQQAVSPNLHLMFVPAHHFLFYLQALEDILFGVGLISICRFVALTLPKLFAKRGPQIESQRLRPWMERALVGSSVACFLFLALPSYFNRFDFTTARSQAIGFQERKDYIDAYRWILANSQPKDVFLSLSRDFDLSIVGPADRKTVVTCQPEFSNPYVSWTSRVETATKIVDKVASGDADAPAALSRAGVNFIITEPIEGFDRPQFSFLSKQFSEGDVSIYRVNIN